MENKVSKKTLIAGILTIIIAVIGVLAGYYFSRGYELGNSDRAVKIASIQAPAATDYSGDDKISPDYLYVNFNQPVTDANKIGANFKRGISINPDIREIDGKIYGQTILELPADEAGAARARAWLKQDGVSFEEV